MERFRIEKSEQLGWWVVTDAKNKIKFEFEEHNYNNNQRVSFADDHPNMTASELATAM